MPSALIDTRQAAALLGIARSTLDEMVARAPSNLPGAPVQVGIGTRRRHLRWNPDQIVEWASAYSEWMASNPSTATASLPSKPTRKKSRTARRSSGSRSLLRIVKEDY